MVACDVSVIVSVSNGFEGGPDGIFDPEMPIGPVNNNSQRGDAKIRDARAAALHGAVIASCRWNDRADTTP
jgi:hypothetical protein